MEIQDTKYTVKTSKDFNKFQINKCFTAFIDFKKIFAKGDLLYGTTEDRLELQLQEIIDKFKII